MNLNSSLPWSHMAIEDLTNAIALGKDAEDIADFLCRTTQEVEDKVKELGLKLEKENDQL